MSGWGWRRFRAVTAAAALALGLWPGPSLAEDLPAAVSLFDAGKYAEAEVALRSLSGTEATAYLAASLARQKKYTEAEASAKAALADDGTNPVAVAALGQSLVGQEKYAEAIEGLSKAIVAKPDLAYAYFWRGMAFNKTQQAARMVDDFQTFLRLKPDAPEAANVRQILSALR
jgi:tetratricopeptide (TPR) repeat protein